MTGCGNTIIANLIVEIIIIQDLQETSIDTENNCGSKNIVPDPGRLDGDFSAVGGIWKARL
jgi:hypothetical protein